MQQLSTSFKALGDPVRLRLFALLGHHKELCVCHLVDALQLPQSTISRQLSILRHADLLQTRRDGKWMYYRLHGELAQELFQVIQQGNNSQIQQDMRTIESS